MKEEDFDKVISRVICTFALPGDVHDEKLIFKTEQIPVFETNQMYKSVSNERIAKTKLMRPFDRYKMLIPQYEVFCLPGDEEKAAEAIRQKLEPELLKMLDHLQGLVSAVSGGVLVLDGKAFMDRNAERCEINRIRRASFNTAVLKASDDPEP
jgi:hypothetical protein